METEVCWLFEDQTLTRDVKPVIPQDAVVFSKDRVVHHLQADNQWKLYSVDLFDRQTLPKLQTQSADLGNAQPFQAERAKALYDLLGGKSDTVRYRILTDLITQTLSGGKRVFVILPKPELLLAR